MGRFRVSLFETFVPVSVSGDHIYDDGQRASATIFNCEIIQGISSILISLVSNLRKVYIFSSEN